MTSEDILKKETPTYIGPQNIGGISCDIGYIKEFRLSWFATQLNTFVIIGRTEERIDKKMIENFSSQCFAFALKNSKGWPRGLQAGIASIAILQGNLIDQDAIVFCEKLSKKHWSAFEIPVIYDLEQKKRIRYKSAPIWGTIYFPFFTKKIDAVTAAMGQP